MSPYDLTPAEVSWEARREELRELAACPDITTNEKINDASIAQARVALAQILSVIRHRHSQVRHNLLEIFVTDSDFTELAGFARYPAEPLRVVFFTELRRAREAGKVLERGVRE